MSRGKYVHFMVQQCPFNSPESQLTEAEAKNKNKKKCLLRRSDQQD